MSLETYTSKPLYQLVELHRTSENMRERITVGAEIAARITPTIQIVPQIQGGLRNLNGHPSHCLCHYCI